MGIFFSILCRLRDEQPFKKDLRVRLFKNKDPAQVEFCRTLEQTGRTPLCKLHLKIPTQSTDHTVSFCASHLGLRNLNRFGLLYIVKIIWSYRILFQTAAAKNKNFVRIFPAKRLWVLCWASILSKISWLVVSKLSVYTVNHTKIATVHVKYKTHHHVAHSIKAPGHCLDVVGVAYKKLLLFAL